MKHVVVIAGNITQFQDFVRNALKNGIYNTINYSVGVGNKIISEGLTFMYVYDSYQFHGYNFGKDAKLVKVGTWYKLSSKVVEGIENNFNLRKR